jgi:cell division septation protein DedD
MRDLDQIEERDGDERARKLGVVAITAFSVAILMFALGVVIGRAATPPPPEEDPLAKLEPLPPAPAPKKVEVKAAELTFPQKLTGEQDSPEVLAALEAAALEAAALEEASLAAGDAEAPPDDTIAANDVPQAMDDAPIATEARTLPASVAAANGQDALNLAADGDPLVAQVIAGGSGPLAPRGSDGDFTLQVISYDRPERARTFAQGLRARGHRAFVSEAKVDERGRYWRVRVGPFDSRREADEYRRRFETEERMNTYVVRRERDT